jgi:hypothetical protein
LENLKMPKQQDDIKKPSKAEVLKPPAWFSRPEKRLFLRLIEALKAANRPVLPGQLDTLIDLVTCRSRIAALRKMLEDALTKSDEFPPAQRHAASLIRQIDTSTALARRLARDLRLLGAD